MKKLCLILFALLLALLCFAGCDETGGGAGGGDITVRYQIGDTVVELTDAPDYFNGASYRAEKAVAPAGYYFAGWYSADGVQYFYANRTKVPDILLDRDITLIAKFTPASYSFVLDAGEENFAGGASEKTVLADYGSVLQEFPTPVIKDPAVCLDGYFTEDGTRYTNGTTPVADVLNFENYPAIPFEEQGANALAPSENPTEIRLYAVYTARKITVTLDYNDGSLETVVLERGYGEALGSLDAYYKDTGKEGIVFWSTNPYSDVAAPEYLTESIRLYAVWKPYKTVSFIMPDGEARDEKIYQDANRIPLPNVEAPGYRLLGWYLTNSLSGNKVESVHYDTMQSTYYGKWQLTDYALTFTGKGIELDEMRYYYGDTVVLPIPDVTGYAFLGWYTDDPENSFYALPTDMWGDITLTANLQPNTYILSLNAGGGRLNSSFASVEYDANFTVPVPEKDGYTFLGWYDAPYDGKKLTNQRGVGLAPWTVADRGVVIYAYWEAKSYIVAFNTDGGTTVAPTVYTHGSAFVPPPAPLKMGLLFNGWCTEDGTPYTDGSIITDNITLYAQWIESTPIFNAEDLLAVKDNPAGNYHLMNDINMGSVTWAALPEFTGIFDGQGYKIYNLLLTNSSANNFGFISVNRGTVRNITFEKITLNYNRGTYTCAGIVAACNYGILQNCRVVESSMLCKFSYQVQNTGVFSYIGALAGYNYGTITGCYTNAYIEGHTTALSDWEGRGTLWYDSNLAIGGLTGGSNGTVSNCAADATLRGYGITQNYGTYYPGTSTHGQVVILAGGLIGSVSGGTVDLCTASPDALIKATSLGCGSNYFYSRIGGFIGVMNKGTVTRCYSAGTVQGYGTNATGHTGGFVGVTYDGSIITNCYSETLTLAGNSVDKPAGFASFVAGVITDCYANNAEGSVGNGFVYQVTSTGTVRRCFTTRSGFVGSNSGIVDTYFTVSDTPDGEHALSASDIMNREFLLGTLFWEESVWNITGEDYPTLRGLTDSEEGGEEA